MRKENQAHFVGGFCYVIANLSKNEIFTTEFHTVSCLTFSFVFVLLDNLKLKSPEK